MAKRGRKKTWLCESKPKSIRVPESIAGEVMNLARVIDRGLHSDGFDKSIIQEILEIVADTGLETYPEVPDIYDCDQEDEDGDEDDYRNLLSSIQEDFSQEEIPDYAPASLDTSQSSIRLSPDQQLAMNDMKEFINNPVGTYYRLSGYAGTGKSYLIVQLMDYLNAIRREFIAASPTNKAVKNLKKLAAEANVSLDAKTISQLLGQQPEVDQETGKQEFISSDDCDISQYDVVIIDEYSMISKKNFSDLESVLQYSNSRIKVIFVGDDKQLPPVNEQEPIVAIHPDIKRQSTLSTIVRYDGEIARIAEEIRSDSHYNRHRYPFKTTDDQTVLCLPRGQWLDLAYERFQSPEYKADPNFVRFLVWRNNTAASLNAFVRSRLWGVNAPPYVQGDRLIAKRPVFRLSPPVGGKRDWKIVMNNSEECEVIEDGELMQTDGTNPWEYWRVPVKTDDGLVVNLQVLTEEGEKLRKNEMDEYKKMKKWKEYYHLMKSFDDVPYAYALTTHKAQGSGIDYVFLETPDLFSCFNKQKILYTALTRAKRAALIPRS